MHLVTSRAVLAHASGGLKLKPNRDAGKPRRLRDDGIGLKMIPK